MLGTRTHSQIPLWNLKETRFPSQLFHRPRDFFPAAPLLRSGNLKGFAPEKRQVFTMFYLPNLGERCRCQPISGPRLCSMSKLQLFHLLLAVKCYTTKKKMLCPGKTPDLKWCEAGCISFNSQTSGLSMNLCYQVTKLKMLETILRLIEWSGIFIASTKWLYKLRDSSIVIDKNHHHTFDIHLWFLPPWKCGFVSDLGRFFQLSLNPPSRCASLSQPLKPAGWHPNPKPSSSDEDVCSYKPWFFLILVGVNIHIYIL